MSLVLEWRTGQVTFARRTLLPCQPYHWRCPSHIWIYHQISSVTRQNSFPYHIWQEMSRASVSSASMLRFHQMLFIVWDGFVCLSINWPILVDWDWMFLPFMEELLLDPSPLWGLTSWPPGVRQLPQSGSTCHNQLQRWNKTSIETCVFEFDTCEFLEEIMCANVGCDALMGFTRHLNKFGEAARFLLGALQYTVSISRASVNNSTLGAPSSTCFRM